MRTNADYRKKENVRDRNRKQIARSSFLNKKAEQEYNTKKRKQARTDANYRQLEQQNDTKKRKQARTDANYRQLEQQNDTSRIVQIKFERERGMRRLHHILFTWPASWLVSKVLRQQSLLAMHESYGLSAVPTKIVAWFSQGGERNKRIASRIVQIKFERERAMRGSHHILFTWPAMIKSAEAAIFVSNAWILWAQRCANKDCCLVERRREE